MHADEYLDSLLEELEFGVLQRAMSVTVATSRLLGATSAMEVVGLLSREHGQRRLDDFERTLHEHGVIQRVGGVAQSSTMTATASGSARAPKHEVIVPSLERVVPVGVELNLDQPYATYLLSLTLWSHFVDLTFAVTGYEEDREYRSVARADPVRRMMGHPEIEWRLWDDTGTRYHVHRASGGGGPDLIVRRIGLSPRVPRAAKSITILASTPDGNSDERTVQL